MFTQINFAAREHKFGGIPLSHKKSVWVTEVWRSQEEHDASLTIESVQANIKQVLPLLAGSPEKIDVLPVGGKGFTLA